MIQARSGSHRAKNFMFFQGRICGFGASNLLARNFFGLQVGFYQPTEKSRIYCIFRSFLITRNKYQYTDNILTIRPFTTC